LPLPLPPLFFLGEDSSSPLSQLTNDQLQQAGAVGTQAVSKG
jgi:hypothetical protein